MNAINYITSKIPPVAYALGWAAKETAIEMARLMPDLLYGVWDAKEYISIPSLYRDATRQFIHLTLSTPIESSQPQNGSFRESESCITATKIGVGLLAACTILNSYAHNRDLAYPLLAPVYAITALMIGENGAFNSALCGSAFALTTFGAATFSNNVFQIFSPEALH